jgi:hypothetical protein
VGELESQLRFADAAKADQGCATGGLGTSLVDSFKNITAFDEIEVAIEGDRGERLRLRFAWFLQTSN